MQHATHDEPNLATGYCTDDVARAFMVAIARLRAVPDDTDAAAMSETYLRFLKAAQRADGLFRNFRSIEKVWLDDVGSEDSCGRAVWALGYGVRFAPERRWRAECAGMLERSVPALANFQHLRAQAFAILGLTHAVASGASPVISFKDPLRQLAGALAACYDQESTPSWSWFSDHLTYDNARLPEAALRAAEALGNPRLRVTGLASLAFYESVTMLDGIFVPVGSNGWYFRGGDRALYAQQPLEASAMVDAELAAYDANGDERHLAAARTALEWFHGTNSVGAALAHPSGGGRDGLEEHGTNDNMGAESTLAFLAASYAMAERDAA